jgi:CTP:phosphocholine cytidylyltransferase-like protein
MKRLYETYSNIATLYRIQRFLATLIYERGIVQTVIYMKINIFNEHLTEEISE